MATEPGNHFSLFIGARTMRQPGGSRSLAGLRTVALRDEQAIAAGNATMQALNFYKWHTYRIPDCLTWDEKPSVELSERMLLSRPI